MSFRRGWAILSAGGKVPRSSSRARGFAIADGSVPKWPIRTATRYTSLSGSSEPASGICVTGSCFDEDRLLRLGRIGYAYRRVTIARPSSPAFAGEDSFTLSYDYIKRSPAPKTPGHPDCAGRRQSLPCFSDLRRRPTAFSVSYDHLPEFSTSAERRRYRRSSKNR